MILNETCAKIAEAIREKTGKSDLIAPKDFASEIKGITSGGESGDSVPFLYYKIDGVACKEAFEGLGITDFASMYSAVANIGDLIDAFVAYVYRGYLGKENTLKGGVTSSSAEWKIADWTGVMYYPLSKDTGGYHEIWSLMGMDTSWITPCTKEEFEALITA